MNLRIVTRAAISVLLVGAMILMIARGDWGGILHAPGATQASFSGPTMGTSYRVSLPALPEGIPAEELQSQIDAHLQTINEQMSTWLPDSELSRFNAHQGGEWFEVSPATAFVVAEAGRISELSGGAFDVTVGPLVDLWGFGPDPRMDTVPTDAEITAQKARTGFQGIEVQLEPSALRKTHNDLKIDLSAIAKGFAVDDLAGYLDSLDAPAYMIEVGGEVRTRGRKLDGSGWRIGIESPLEDRRDIYDIVTLSGESMATSGDYRNFFRSDGKTYSHTIDPRTGRPITHNVASVSIVADRCATADGLATALMVLGPVEGYNLAMELEIAAYFVVREDDQFRSFSTPLFSKYLGEPRSRK